MAELAPLEEVAAVNAEGDVCWIRIAGDGLDLGGGFWGETLVGINVKYPGIAKGDISQAPILVRGPVIEGAFDDARAGRPCDFLSEIRAAGVVDDDVITPGNGFKTTRQVLLLIFGEN
jgi:hypothetical protein